MADLVSNLQSIYNTKLQIKDAIGTDSDIFADYPNYINSLKPTGYAYITTNGDHNVNAYSYVNVNVPTGGAAVLGNLSVTENGQYSASTYSYDGFDTVNVNVPIPTLGEAMITANGNYNAHDLGYDGLNSVTVNVPTGGSSTHTLSVSGQYGISNGKYFIYYNNTYLTFSGPLANMNLGDTVSGTAEYMDFDGLGNMSTYLFKNFVGAGIQDPNRVYTNFNVENYYGGSQTIISTVTSSVNSNYIDLYSSDVMKTTYSLPSNYSGAQISDGSTVYCYVSTVNINGMNKYLINEVVNVVNANLTGVKYSPDGGKTWTPMVSDTMINGYSLDNLGISISSKNSKGLTIKFEYNNGSYKYVTNYVSINSGDSPYSSNIQMQSYEKEMSIYNDSSNTIEVSKIGVNNDTIYVYWRQGVTYNYRIIATDSNGNPTGNKYVMQNDPSFGLRYNNWNDNNIEYFYIQKYIAGVAAEDTVIENYKPSDTINMEFSSRYFVSTAGTGLFHLTENVKNRIYFNVNNMQVWYEKMNYISLRNSNNTELCKVYTMEAGGITFNNTDTVSGCYFTDAGGAINYKPNENTSISSTYIGTVFVNNTNNGTITIDAGNYTLYYFDDKEPNTKGVYIHGNNVTA